MPASAIRKLVPFADAARKRGVHIYHLNIGQPDIPTPREMIDAYRGYDETVLAYGHSAGSLEYRESLTEYYERYDISVSAEQILVTTGGSEAIIFALMAVCGDGDNILVPEPFYTNYTGFAVMAGVEVRPIPTSAGDGFHLPPRAAIEAVMDTRTRAVLYSSPGNPTGAVFGRAELEMLRDLALEHGLYLIADEVYREFVYDGQRHTSLFHLDGLEDRGILIDSVSKRFRMHHLPQPRAERQRPAFRPSEVVPAHRGPDRRPRSARDTATLLRRRARGVREAPRRSGRSPPEAPRRRVHDARRRLLPDGAAAGRRRRRLLPVDPA